MEDAVETFRGVSANNVRSEHFIIELAAERKDAADHAYHPCYCWIGPTASSVAACCEDIFR
jgi:hypothetical protein